MEFTSKETFYSDAKDYWDNVDPTIDGMLGGFSEISVIDAKESKKFLQPLLQQNNISKDDSRVLDCGAGIGRVTKSTLSCFFGRFDLVEQSQQFLDNAKSYLGDQMAGLVENLFCSGLQDFTPQSRRYDVIWIQWVTGHLSNQAFVDFLQRCQEGLKPNGFIVLKENIASSEDVDIDETDSSITRPRSLLLSIFEEAGLIILKEKVQSNFPPGLYTVRMFALR